MHLIISLSTFSFGLHFFFVCRFPQWIKPVLFPIYFIFSNTWLLRGLFWVTNSALNPDHQVHFNTCRVHSCGFLKLWMSLREDEIMGRCFGRRLWAPTVRDSLVPFFLVRPGASYLAPWVTCPSSGDISAVFLSLRRVMKRKEEKVKTQPVVWISEKALNPAIHPFHFISWV